MKGNPTIKYTGAGSRREAAELSRAVTEGVVNALATRTEPLHIDTLRVRVPAGAGSGVIERAIRAAITGRQKGSHK